MIAEPSLIVRRRAEPGEHGDRVRAPRLRGPGRVVAEPLGLLRELDQLERVRPRRRVAHVEAEAHRPAMLTAVTRTDLARPPSSRSCAARYRAFMDEHVYPNEAALAREDDDADSRSSRRCGERAKEPRACGRRTSRRRPAAPGRASSPTRYLNEEIGRSIWAQLVFGCQAPDAGNGEILHLFGTDEQKERFLRPLVAGEVRSFFSMTEPEVAGSDPTPLRTRAVRDGDEWVIDGHKWFSSGAEGAALRDRHGGHRPGRARRTGAPRRSSCPPTRPGSRSCARCRRWATPGAAGRPTARSATRACACPVDEHARRAGRRLPHRAEAARPGPHPPRHALARPDAARVRADVHVRARARGVRRRRSPTSRRCRTGSPTRRPRSRRAG